MGEEPVCICSSFFSGNITNLDLLTKSIFAFIIFSLAASVVYILNDYNDIEADKKHPEKEEDLWQVEPFQNLRQ
jgi:4-hydroxybenzoate polyprenyltransferase